MLIERRVLLQDSPDLGGEVGHLLADPTPGLIVVMQHEVVKVLAPEAGKSTHAAILQELDELLYQQSRASIRQTGQECTEENVNFRPSLQLDRGLPAFDLPQK